MAGKSSAAASSSSASSKKTSKKPSPQPISIPRQAQHAPATNDTFVPLSMSFTRNDILGAIHRTDDSYPKVDEHESVNSLNGDFGKFLPPHVIGQRQREKEIARSYDKHSRRRYNHLY